MKTVKVTGSFILRYWKDIQNALNYPGLHRDSPRRKLVEICRSFCHYSENTLPADIWAAIIRRYNNLVSHG